MCALLYTHLAIRDSERGCTNRSRHDHKYYKVLERKKRYQVTDPGEGDPKFFNG